MSVSEFRKLPPGEQALLVAADIWNWDRQAKANKNQQDVVRQNLAAQARASRGRG